MIYGQNVLAFKFQIQYNVTHNFKEVKLMAEFKYEIVEKLGVISQGKGGWERQLNLVSWGEREPKYDIRDWSPDGTKMGKGISLTAEELAVLKEILDEIDL